MSRSAACKDVALWDSMTTCCPSIKYSSEVGSPCTAAAGRGAAGASAPLRSAFGCHPSRVPLRQQPWGISRNARRAALASVPRRGRAAARPLLPTPRLLLPLAVVNASLALSASTAAPGRRARPARGPSLRPPPAAAPRAWPLAPAAPPLRGAACPPSAARAPLLCSGVACSPIRAAAGSASPWRGGGANAWPFFPRGAPARPPAAAASGGSLTLAAGRAIWAAAPRASRGSPRGAPVGLPAPLAVWCCRSLLPCAPPPRRPRWGLRGARGLLSRGAAAPRASAAPPGAPAPPPVSSLSHRRQGSPAARPAALTAARSVFRPPGLTSPAGCAIILVRGLLTAPLGASLVESVVQDGCPVERPGSFFESTLALICYYNAP